MTQPSWILVMGVSGSGKTTLGWHLADRIGGYFLDGDDFHSSANIQKMADGRPLTDDDRDSWLNSIREAIRERLGHVPLVVACSALKEKHRRQLAEIPCQLIYLKGSPEQILPRLLARSGHFMPPSLLSSQFEALEEPKDALVISVSWSVEESVDYIVRNIVSLD